MKAIIINSCLGSAQRGRAVLQDPLQQQFWDLLSRVLLAETACFGMCGLREWKSSTGQNTLSRDNSGGWVIVCARGGGCKRVLKMKGAGGVMEREPDPMVMCSGLFGEAQPLQSPPCLKGLVKQNCV